MELLEQRILKDGVVKAGNVLKVDSFLNHCMDVKLFQEMGREFARLYEGAGINKILTIESSGIGIACITAMVFDVPVVYAKKTITLNIDGEVYGAKVHSFTHQADYTVIVSQKFLGPEDRVLIIDDFLANGCALEGLSDIVRQSGAELIGAGIAIEKGFQEGGRLLREKGLRIESLAIIDSMNSETGEIEFRHE